MVSGGEKEISEAARQHLAGCPSCQEHVCEEEKLRTHLRGMAETEHVPQALHEHLRKMVLGEKLASERPRLQWWAAAAAIALAALGGYTLKWYYSERAPSPDRLAQVFITDHLHYLPGREQIASESPQDMQRWFQGRVEFPVRVPTVPAAALEDARVCMVAGRKAALVHYRHKPDDTLISLFVAEAPRNLREASGSGPLSVSYQGCNAALWSSRGLVYSLVAALDDASLKHLMESVRQQQP